MSAQFITPEEVIAVKAKFPDSCILLLDIDNTKENSNKTFPTSYIPLKIQRLSGNPTRVNLKISKQILASNAKIPFGVLPKDAKDVRTVFRLLTKDDLADTKYLENRHEELLKQNAELIRAFDILCDEYESISSEKIVNYLGNSFTVGKNKTINSIRQSMRNASKDEQRADNKRDADKRQVVDGKIPLPVSLYRIKLTANIHTKVLGQHTGTGHRYVVYDARKVKKSSGCKPVVAKIRSNGSMVDLNTDNAKHFITYMSLSGGVIDFDSVCISKSGISLSNKWRDIHVWPHPTMVSKTIDEDELAEMASMGASGFDDEIDISNIDEPKPNGDDNGNDNGDDSEEDFLDEPVKVKTGKKKNISKSSKKAVTKSSKKAVTKSSRKTSKKKEAEVEEFLDGEPESNEEAEESNEEAEESNEEAEESNEEEAEESNEEEAEVPKSKPKLKSKTKPKPKTK
jgi:hypothetical protein